MYKCFRSKVFMLFAIISAFSLRVNAQPLQIPQQAAIKK